jgi:hypothetical protein
MSKRVPPSAEQIEQALTDHLMNLPAEYAYRAVLPIDEAKRVLAKAFSTSHAKAYEWLLDIAASDTHPVEVLRVGGNGRVYDVLRRGKTAGNVRWEPLAATYGHTISTDTPRLALAWSVVAVADKADARYNPLETRPGEGAEVVAVTRLFAPIVQEYAEHYAGERVAREGDKILQRAAIEHEHGDALARLRGLLDLAGATHPIDADDLMTVRYSKRAQVTITLVGDAIDQVGELLAKLGVPAKTED